MPILHQIQQNLTIFEPFLTQKVTVERDCFHQRSQRVADFVAEMEGVIRELAQSKEAERTKFLADRLVQQFSSLQMAVQALQKPERKTFASSYRFPRNVHNLPPQRRIVEYRKAHRALSEKLSWLTDQLYATQVESEKDHWLAQIQETEQRLLRCRVAIDELEEFRGNP